MAEEGAPEGELPVEYRPRVDYMKRYIGMCKMIAMWPRENANPIRYWLTFFVVLTSGSFIVSAMYVHIYRQSSDIDGVAQVVDFATVYTSALFRFLHVFVNGRRYKGMVDYMNDNFVQESFNRRGQKLTMERYVKIGKFISFSYSTLIQVWLLQMSATPFVLYYIRKSMKHEDGSLIYPNATLKMSIDISMPFDTSQQHLAYLSYVISITSYYTMALVYSCMDSFWFVTLVLTTGQFELIAHSIRSYSEEEKEEEANEEEKPDNPDDQIEMENVINSCLDQHYRIRKFVHTVEDLMHPSVLVDFLHAVASISFILLDMTLALYQASPIKILNLLEYLMVSVFHMWVLDYFGNELTLKEQDISTAIYEIPWYKHPKKVKSQVLLMVILARNPCRLTGGKLYKVSLEFFAGTMKIIFSYFTVLLQLREATATPNEESPAIT